MTALLLRMGIIPLRVGATLIVIAVLCTGPLRGQGELTPVADTTRTSDRISIDHADFLRQVQDRGGNETTYMRGNIELSQDSIFMYCDSSVIRNRNFVQAFGNVLIQKGDSIEIYTDTLAYDSGTRIAVLTGEVVLKHLEDQLWTTHLIYDLNTDLATYNQSAVLFNDSTQVASKRGYYWVQADSCKLVDSVVVIGDNVTLLTDSLIYLTKLQQARFIAPTLILQDDAEIYCEEGYYDVAERNAEFRMEAEYREGDVRALADIIRYTSRDSLVALIGNAHYEEGARKVSGDQILYYEGSGETVVTGNAAFQDSTRQASADTIFYNRHTEQLRSAGRATFTEGSQRLRSETMAFDEVTGFGMVTGNVVFRDTASNAVIECDTAIYNKETGYVKAYGARRPLLKTLVDEDTLYMTADTLISLSRTDTATADTFRLFRGYYDVRLFKGDLQGICDSLSFDGRDSIFHMLGTPVLWSDTTQFIADTIDIALHNEKIDTVYLRQKALIVSLVHEAFYNQIKGRHMTANFEQEDLHDLFVQGNAESIYYVRDDVQAFVGVNQVASSAIYFTFDGGNIEEITFRGQPSGQLTPMRQADHATLRLEGFAWKEELRPKSIEDLFRKPNAL